MKATTGKKGLRELERKLGRALRLRAQAWAMYLRWTTEARRLSAIKYDKKD